MDSNKHRSSTLVIALEDGKLPKGKLNFEVQSPGKNEISGIPYKGTFFPADKDAKSKEIFAKTHENLPPGFGHTDSDEPKNFDALTQTEWWSEPHMLTFKPPVGDKEGVLWMLTISEDDVSWRKGTYYFARGENDGAKWVVAKFPGEKPPVANLVRLVIAGNKLENEMEVVMNESWFIDGQGDCAILGKLR